jgi:hypothetical protein
MSRLAMISRWIAAFLVAAIVWLTVGTLGALIWQNLGTDPVVTTDWAICLATLLAVLSGTFVVPHKQRKAAALTLWMLPIVVILWLVIQDSLAGRLRVGNLYELSGVFLGGLIAFYSIGLVAMTARGTAVLVEKESEIEKFTLAWWLNKLRLALGIPLFFLLIFLVFLGLVLVWPPYGLYTAWKYHTVYIHGPVDGVAAVSYEAHPAAFWFLVFLGILATVMLIAIVAFVIWSVRNDRGMWRRRKARPPIDAAVRRSISDR